MCVYVHTYACVFSVITAVLWGVWGWGLLLGITCFLHSSFLVCVVLFGFGFWFGVAIACITFIFIRNRKVVFEPYVAKMKVRI